MTSALNSKEVIASEFQQSINKLKFELGDNISDAGRFHDSDTKASRSLYRDVTEKQPGVSKRDYLLFGILVFGLHVAGIEAYIHMDKKPALQRPKKSEVVVEFIKPEVIPPPKIEPSKPLPPPPKPKVIRQSTPPPRPAPALHTAPAEQNIVPDDMTVKENTEAPRSADPVVAEPSPPPTPPAPPPPPKEEPVTEATGYAGYLKNPAPDYPAVAQRQGWEGKVILRVKVLANGTASAVEVKQSSKRKVLDDAAVAAVKGWMFSPSKRGNTAVDGWATVPIEFHLAQ
ncbi:MAG TPA: energy transducer TonB [Methylotenera sp.]|nr:energy transducer TonB [Methylotenera sp.]